MRPLKVLISLLIALTISVNGACCITVTTSSGGASGSASDSMTIKASKNTDVSGQVTIGESQITSLNTISGPVPLFEKTHSVKDATGKTAKVYVKVVNAPNGLTYDSNVFPKEGTVSTQPYVWAEQWLTVPKADSITCTASSSYKTWSSSASLAMTKDSKTGSYVTLKDYYGKAYASDDSIYSKATAASGSGNSIKLTDKVKDSTGTYSISTSIGKGSLDLGSFQNLKDSAVTGISTPSQVTQSGRVYGSLSSTAVVNNPDGTLLKSTKRTSNYGSKYDINMLAKKGPTVSGKLGYYVSPSTSANKIQGAIDASQSGDTINVAAGTYNENVVIDKSLNVKGASYSNTIVNGMKKGSVFTIGTINPNIDVTLSGLKITGGTGVSQAWGGGIYNWESKATIKNCLVEGNSAAGGGGVLNYGTIAITDSIISKNSADEGAGVYNSHGVATITNSVISDNSAKWGGGVINENVGKVTITGSTISKNSAIAGGGILNYGSSTISGSKISENSANSGGGIYNEATTNIAGSTISKNSAVYYGGGVYNENGCTVTIKDSTLSGNSANCGGGVFARGTATITGSTLTENSAVLHGGAIYNEGKADIKEDCRIFLNIADAKADGSGFGGGIYLALGGSLVFRDKYGNIISNWSGIVYNNHLKTNTGPISDIYYQ